MQPLLADPARGRRSLSILARRTAPQSEVDAFLSVFSDRLHRGIPGVLRAGDVGGAAAAQRAGRRGAAGARRHRGRGDAAAVDRLRERRRTVGRARCRRASAGRRARRARRHARPLDRRAADRQRGDRAGRIGGGIVDRRCGRSPSWPGSSGSFSSASRRSSSISTTGGRRAGRGTDRRRGRGARASGHAERRARLRRAARISWRHRRSIGHAPAIGPGGDAGGARTRADGRAPGCSCKRWAICRDMSLGFNPDGLSTFGMTLSARYASPDSRSSSSTTSSPSCGRYLA